MKDLLTNMGIGYQKAAEQYKPWTMQQEQVKLYQQHQEKRRILYPGTSQLEGEEIPVHLIEFFERHRKEEEKQEPWEQAIELQRRKREAIEELEKKLEATNQGGWQATSGIRLKQRTIVKLEEILQGRIMEMTNTITCRSTEELIDQNNIMQVINDEQVRGIIINANNL